MIGEDFGESGIERKETYDYITNRGNMRENEDFGMIASANTNELEAYKAFNIGETFTSFGEHKITDNYLSPAAPNEGHNLLLKQNRQ